MKGSSNANAAGRVELPRKCPEISSIYDGVFHRACSCGVDRDWTESMTTPDAAERQVEEARLTLGITLPGGPHLSSRSVRYAVGSTLA